MSLITNNKGALINGVNQQSAEFRRDSQVEEMINAYPTITTGLLKRNPTEEIDSSEEPVYSDETWSYEYDRGLSGSAEELYSIYITDQGMEILDANNGTVLNEDNNGIQYEGNAREYLFPFVSRNGYAATTVKDTTFIVNKNKITRMGGTNTGADAHQRARIKVFSTESATERRVSEKLYDCSGTTLRSTDPHQLKYLAKQKKRYTYKASGYMPDVITVPNPSGGTCRSVPTKASYGSATITLTVDGNIVKLYSDKVTQDVGTYSYVGDIANINQGLTKTPRTFNNILADLVVDSNSALKGHGYTVDHDGTYLNVYKNDVSDNAPVVATISVSFGDPDDCACSIAQPCDNYSSGQKQVLDVATDNFFGVITQDSFIGFDAVSPTEYQRTGYIWLKRGEPVYGFDYSGSVEVQHSDGSTTIYDIQEVKAAKKTQVAAEDLSNNINDIAELTSTFDGSIVRIVTVDSTDIIIAVNAADSYGDTASFGFAQKVKTISDLPKNMGEYSPTIKIVDANDEAAFWVVYKDGTWIETYQPNIERYLDETVLPHVIERHVNASGNIYFLIKAYDSWMERKVGDDDTNKIPFIISSETDPSVQIKDIFFFKNRLGFITKNGVSISEVGKYGNFWRSTVMTLLESDAINTFVDSTKALSLEYAVYLEDSIVLFSGKAQFRMEGGDILSPKDIQISQTSAYEINRDVRPINMNNRIFFAAKRGDHTAIIEYFGSRTSDKFETNDITAHCETYIDADITRLSGSPINNLLFATSHNRADTIYVYKYYDSGEERVQSAWFKWIFSGNIYFAFAMNSKLFIAISRLDKAVFSPWVLDDNVEWDMTGIWADDGIWLMSEESVARRNFFEKMNLEPQGYHEDFADNNSDVITTEVDMGEWVLRAGKTKDIRGHLKFKTVEISSEEGSVFSLSVNDIKRNTTRAIPSNLTVARKPLIFGDAKNIRLSLISDTSDGFRINMVSYEGRISKRAKEL